MGDCWRNCSLDCVQERLVQYRSIVSIVFILPALAGMGTVNRLSLSSMVFHKLREMRPPAVIHGCWLCLDRRLAFIGLASKDRCPA